MKKIILTMAIAALGLVGCCEKQQPKNTGLEINNALTAEEIAAGRLTPEVMWKMNRAGSSSLSPDGTTLLYSITRYNMQENRGISVIYTRDMASGEVRELTDFSSNNNSPAWSADGKTIYFLSNRGGSWQVWQMKADGTAAEQITEREKDVEGFGISNDGAHIWWVEQVRPEGIAFKSSDVYADMAKSKGRIYDDLMARHWDYWDEGSYRHIFVGEVKGSKVENGRDIMPEAAWDAPLAPYFDMAEIAWCPCGMKLAYTCKPLTGKAYAVSTDSDIFIYDVAAGTTENICKPATGAADAMPGYDKYPVWSPDGKKIAFRSMRRAGNESDKDRLFLYDIASKKMTDLTADFDYNAANVVWADNNTIYFISPIAATHQICRVAADNGKVEVLTSGDHDINAFSMAEGRIVAEMCTIRMATEFFNVDMATGAMEQISAFNKEVYDNIAMGEVQKRWVKTTDGKEMLTWVILPPDFDASKKYPVLLYCQGGPQSVVS